MLKNFITGLWVLYVLSLVLYCTETPNEPKRDNLLDPDYPFLQIIETFPEMDSIISLDSEIKIILNGKPDSSAIMKFILVSSEKNNVYEIKDFIIKNNDSTDGLYDLTLSLELTFNDTITIKIIDSLMDLTGRTLKESISWNFFTENIPSPIIIRPMPYSIFNSINGFTNIEWESVYGAKFYHYQVSVNDSIILEDEFAEHVNNNQLSFVEDGEYKFNMRAVSAQEDTSTYSNIRFLVDTKPVPPSLVRPQDGITVNHENGCTFEWNSITSSSTFEIDSCHFRVVKGLDIGVGDSILIDTYLKVDSLEINFSDERWNNAWYTWGVKVI